MRVKNFRVMALIAGTVTASTVACTSATSSPPQTISSVTTASPSGVSSTSAPVTTSAAPTSASEDKPCAGGQFAHQQFVGDWTEQGGTTTKTLSDDGTLSSRNGATVESGTWSYTPWQNSPAKDQMPASAANQCVLWLHLTEPAPASDLVYVPLKLTDTALELSYVGRGNTLTWARPTGTQQ